MHLRKIINAILFVDFIIFFPIKLKSLSLLKKYKIKEIDPN